MFYHALLINIIVMVMLKAVVQHRIAYANVISRLLPVDSFMGNKLLLDY